MSQLRKWADEHQYDAEPQPGATENNGVMPSVHLLHMTEDPLGVLAAQNGIYKGRVIRNLAEVTDDMRRESFEDMMKTTLQSPLESIKMHWVLEGVDRAFTHQIVRQRTANFGQESLRFSVVGPLIDSTTLPPELHGTERSNIIEIDHISFFDLVNGPTFSYASQDERNRAVWDWVVMGIDAGYHYLVEHGIAAEEARGLLPHATATRIHYQVDLRGLMKVMGERLCTQAQFHWRTVAALIQRAVREYTPNFETYVPAGWESQDQRGGIIEIMRDAWEQNNRWQFELIADSGIFRPVCFQTGHCMFMASADRGCTIRPRVEAGQFDQIKKAEWLLNPAAARTVS